MNDVGKLRESNDKLDLTGISHAVPNLKIPRPKSAIEKELAEGVKSDMTLRNSSGYWKSVRENTARRNERRSQGKTT